MWFWFTESYKKEKWKQLVASEEAEVMQETLGPWWLA